MESIDAQVNLQTLLALFNSTEWLANAGYFDSE
jgi:hypothetical protein